MFPHIPAVCSRGAGSLGNWVKDVRPEGMDELKCQG